MEECTTGKVCGAVSVDCVAFGGLQVARRYSRRVLVWGR